MVAGSCFLHPFHDEPMISLYHSPGRSAAPSYSTQHHHFHSQWTDKKCVHHIFTPLLGKDASTMHQHCCVSLHAGAPQQSRIVVALVTI